MEIVLLTPTIFSTSSISPTSIALVLTETYLCLLAKFPIFSISWIYTGLTLALGAGGAGLRTQSDPCNDCLPQPQWMDMCFKCTWNQYQLTTFPNMGE